MSISPGLSPRQRPDRYAFRAGRNLPDNEFRYLRTVIVTAAVHRGFGRQLLLANNQLPSPSGTGQASAPIDCLTTLRRPVFLVNSRLGLVTAALFTGHPFSRSYGAILPSSLERVLPRPLVFSTYLPVSVSGTGSLITYVVRAFLGRKILYIKHQLDKLANKPANN